MFKLTIAAVALALGGCAIPMGHSDHNWYHSGAEALPMVVKKTSQKNVRAVCCNTEVNILACSYRDYQKKVCTVITSEPWLPGSVLEHEKMHCDGWEHDVVKPSAVVKQCKTPDDIFKG